MELESNNNENDNDLKELVNDIVINQEDLENKNNSPKFSNTSSVINNNENNNMNQNKNKNPSDSKNIQNYLFLNDMNENILKKNSSQQSFFIKKINTKKTANKFNKQTKKSLNKNLPKCHSDYFKNYPKTIFQKMIIDLDKIKIKTDQVINVMKKNVRLTNEEISRNTKYRLNQSKMTNQSNFNRTNKSNFLMTNTSTHFHTFLQSQYKNFSNNNSSTLINFYNNNSSKNTIENKKNNRSNSQELIPLFYLNTKEKLGLKKIPYPKISSIKKELPYRPLFNIDNTKKFYKCMFHFRNFNIEEKILFSHAYNIYNISPALVAQTSYCKAPDINLMNICNKIKLIQDNIEYFQINYMYKNIFLDAFNNMENHQKAQFNSAMEEICVLLFKLIPLLLKNYYIALKKTLSLGTPDIEKEMSKSPENESECLKINYVFFNSVNEYFNICMEIYRIIQKKFFRFVYDEIEFVPLNTFLDLARYSTSMLNSIAIMYIRKTEKDIVILQKLEGGLKLRKKYRDKRDNLEKYLERHRFKFQDEDIKLERINNVLDFKRGAKKKIIKNKSEENISKNKIEKNVSVINTSIFRDMMKYFKPSAREKIITQQVIERYKKMEEKRLQEGNESMDED